MLPQEIVSGGQTGADRAALDWAIATGLPHGGWCPEDRLAEDGTVPEVYQLRETTSESYALRTEWNVRDSDATVIFSLASDLTGGSAATRYFARSHDKAFLHLSRVRCQTVEAAAERLRSFISENFVLKLNVAGPRVSTEPEIGKFVRETLELAFPDAGRERVDE